MPSSRSEMLIELFSSISDAKTIKLKSDLLSKAKYIFYNELIDEEITAFFCENPLHFQNLFFLDIWSGSVEEKRGVVEFFEPYDIMERILASFPNLTRLLDLFLEQLIFTFDQNKDEKVKHICIQFLIRSLDLLEMPEGEQDLIQLESNLQKHFKRLLPHMIRQVPMSSVSYNGLLTQLISLITIKLNSIQEQISSKELEVEVFNSSVFENNKSLIDEFENVAKLNSIQAFRVLELFVHLGALSKNHLLSICEEKFHLSTKIQDLLNEKYDILSLINCIELFNILANTLHGLQYLEKNGFLTHLINTLKNHDPMTSILVPSIIKLFSHIVREQPEYIYETHRFYYEFLFEKFKNEENDQSMFNLAIETFSFLFEYNLVKKFFDEKFNKELEYVLDKLIFVLKNSINDQLRVNTLICVANLISTDPALLQTNNTDEKWLSSPWNASEWHELAHTFYTKMTSKINHENLFQICLNLAKKPFPELRLAAQLYFKALAQTKWGINALFAANKYNSFEDFLVGYLTNRSIEQEKLGLESKFELIKLILANMNLNTNLICLIGEDGMARLNLYVREGVFFAKAESRVAFEGE